MTSAPIGVTAEEPSQITLRPLQIDDQGVTFQWQSDPNIRRYFRNSKTPTEADHATWIQNRVQDRTNPAWVILLDGQPSGVVRIDQSGRASFEVSILVAPEAQGRNLGKTALELLQKTRPFSGFSAQVSLENQPSLALFRSAGFEEQKPGAFQTPALFGGARIALFANAKGTTGLGHAQRCLALADAIADAGMAPVVFIQGRADLKLPSSQTGVELMTLPDDADIAFVCEGAKALVVDHYDVDIADITDTARYPVIVLDDLADRPLPAALVVNGSPAARDLPYDTMAPTQYLLGSDYQIIRPGLHRSENRSRALLAEPKRLFISIGGSDPLGIASELLAITVKVLERWPHLRADFAIATPLTTPPPDHPRLQIHINPPHITELISRADIAVSAGGQTMFELVYCGIPTAVFRVADNQDRNVGAMAASDCIVDIGWADDPDWQSDLERVLEKLQLDSALRQQLSVNSLRQIDGNGARRIADSIGALLS